jgi:hypothetical protein
MAESKRKKKPRNKRLIVVFVVLAIAVIFVGSSATGIYLYSSNKKTESGISALDAWAIGKSGLQVLWGDHVGLVQVKTDKINDDGTASFWRFNCKSTINEEIIAYVFVYYGGSVKIQTENLNKYEFGFSVSCCANWSIDSTYAYPKALKDPVVKDYLSRHFTNNLHQIYMLPVYSELDKCQWYFEWNTYRIIDKKCVRISIDGETGETNYSEEAN